MRTFQNAHRHSTNTNPRIADSVVTNEDYAKRAAELGHGIISTCEHGWQGRYIEGFELAKKYGLKFLFSTEAYWVKDRFLKDNKNCHIFLAALNENGRKSINFALSEANLTGFYGTARLDKTLILSLPKDDIVVTSACLAFWKYDDVEEFVLELNDHFKHFYLEVQYHNTDAQKELNKRILSLHEKYNIPLIMGCDSHYIYEDGAKERTNYIYSRGISYADEDGWYLDYPDGDTAFNRFLEQGILTESQIEEAMNNTNIFLEVEEYNCPCFDKEIKMPSVFPDLTQGQKDDKLEKLIWKSFDSEKKLIPESKWEHYQDEIKKEIEIVKTVKHSDYFLDNYYIMKRAKELGGVLTPSGRGSAVSFYINKLLGFTMVDRISANVKMYPERFMSATRMLEAKTLADIDFNEADTSIFLKAQEEIFGEGHSYPMIAFGTLKPKAAWKMYARAKDVDFQISNEISARITKYEKALKNADEDEKDLIDIADFIGEEYVAIFEESKKYQGIIDSFAIHPCSSLLYSGDIPREIGLIRVKENICCLMDGHWAEDYKFLKNDHLKVNVVKVIDKVFKSVGEEMFDVEELLRRCDGNQKVWDIYKKSLTIGINQVEQKATKGRVAKYAPQNISELCAFIAAIRPGFKSMYDVFESRKPFSYGIKTIDELIQTPQMPKSFILYQEIQMAILNYSGIPMYECYEIIKSISKKRIAKVLKYKEQFLKGFEEKMIEYEKQTQPEAEKLSHNIWKILEDSASYSFNSSHSYCVAVDSLYGSYLKATHPVNFYTEFIKLMEEDGDKDRLVYAKEEAQNGFGIKFPSLKFRQDNRTISCNVAKKEITTSLRSIKGFGTNVGYELYEFKDKEYFHFIDLLYDLYSTTINKTQIEKLIKIDYFSEFGNSKELSMINDYFLAMNCGNAKVMAKDKYNEDEIIYCIVYRNSRVTEKQFREIDCHTCLVELEEYIKLSKVEDYTIREKIITQQDILGYVSICSNKEEDRTKLLILDVRELNSKKTGKIWKYAFKTMSMGSGKVSEILAEPDNYKEFPIKKYDVIKINPKALYSTEWNGRKSWHIKKYVKD